MGKTLKLGFAMGGGVSLGTFSGAALSEAIKQAVLHAGYYTTDENGAKAFTPYTSIVIDVFAGASAGSMSLAIMLRGLAHQTDEERAKAKKKLEDDPAINFASLTAEKKKDLIVAQVVQDLQEDIWINEINIDVLLGANTEQSDSLTFEGGIFKRAALEHIAKKYFALTEAYESNFENRRLLSEEVIFGSSLANLTGLKIDSREGNPMNNPNYVASADAFTSTNHKEFRVFHLFFDEKNKEIVKENPQEYPPKWLRYHNGTSANGFFGNIAKKETWSRIISTSIACGAFPFAFEPVVLERFKFEFDAKQWPDVLDQAVCTLATGRKDGLSYPFTYMDGGTFNNEPVREAFRMAAFLDAKNDPETFDRLIVFVDPSVGTEAVNFRVPIHQKYTVRKPRKILGALDGYDLVKKSSLDKLVPHVGTLISMIINESRVNENDKIAYISDLFNKKSNYNKILSAIVDASAVSLQVLNDVKIELINLINLEKVNDFLPQGALTLEGEMFRVINDQKKEFHVLKEYVADLVANGVEHVPSVLHPVLLKAFLTIFIDRLLNLTGKSKESKIMAVAPITVQDGVKVIENLPGDYLQGFAGFTSKLPNIYEAALAKYCTVALMKDLEIIRSDYILPDIPKWKDQDAYVKDYSVKLNLIKDRIDNLFLNANLIDILPVVDHFVLSNLSKTIKNALEEIELFNDPFYSFVFKIEVEDKKLEIDGAGIYNDFEPIKMDGKLFLVTEIYYFYQPEKARWTGIHVQDKKLVINKDGFLVLPDGGFCTIELPDLKTVALANLMPNPIFEYRKLTVADKGKALPASEWEINPGVIRTDETLLD